MVKKKLNWIDVGNEKYNRPNVRIWRRWRYMEINGEGVDMI